MGAAFGLMFKETRRLTKHSIKSVQKDFMLTFVPVSEVVVQ